MKTRTGMVGLHLARDFWYSINQEVMKMEQKIFDRRSFLKSLIVVALTAIVFLIGASTAQVSYAQEETRLERYWRLLSRTPDRVLHALRFEMEELNANEDSLKEFLELGPREYLEKRDIYLSADSYQIWGIALNEPTDQEKPRWFFRDEPIEGVTANNEGIGMFYDTVGIFIQQVIETPSAILLAPPPVSEANKNYLELTFRIPVEVLNGLGEVVEELSRTEVMDPRRIAFLANPREYLLQRDVQLRRAHFEITAFDFDRASESGALSVSLAGGGLAVVPEGVGIILGRVVIFIQEAL